MNPLNPGRLLLAGSSNAAISSVTASTSDTLLIESNPSRLGVLLFNSTTTAVLYVSLGETAASLTSFSMTLGPSGYIEVPGRFTGEIRGIWDSTDAGAVLITELL